MNWKKAIFILCGGLMFATMVALSWESIYFSYLGLTTTKITEITEENWFFVVQYIFGACRAIVLFLLIYPLSPFFLFGTVYLRGKRKAIVAANPEILKTKENSKAKTIMLVCLIVFTGIVLFMGGHRLVTYIINELTWQYVLEALVPFFDTDSSMLPNMAPYILADFVSFIASLLCAIFGPLFFYYRSQTKVKQEEAPEEVADLKEA